MLLNKIKPSLKFLSKICRKLNHSLLAHHTESFHVTQLHKNSIFFSFLLNSVFNLEAFSKIKFEFHSSLVISTCFHIHWLVSQSITCYRRKHTLKYRSLKAFSCSERSFLPKFDVDRVIRCPSTFPLITVFIGENILSNFESGQKSVGNRLKQSGNHLQ